MREIIIRWLDEASKMNVGDKLNLVASDKKEQDLLYRALAKELEILKSIDPLTGATLVPFKMFKAGRFWTGVEKILAIPTLGFIRQADGKVRKVQLQEIDSQRNRRIKLMCEDGYSLDMINELEGPLSQSEITEINQLKEG